MPAMAVVLFLRNVAFLLWQYLMGCAILLHRERSVQLNCTSAKFYLVGV